MRIPIPLCAAFLFVAAAGADDGNSTRLDFDLGAAPQEWQVGFAGYRADRSPANYHAVAKPLQPSGDDAGGILLKGQNRRRRLAPDALPFLFLKHQVTGLAPTTQYIVTVDSLDLGVRGSISEPTDAPAATFPPVGSIQVAVCETEPAAEYVFEPAFGSAGGTGFMESNFLLQPRRLPAAPQDEADGAYAYTGARGITLGLAAAPPPGSPPQDGSTLLPAKWVERTYSGKGQALGVTTDAQGACWLAVGNHLNFALPTSNIYRRLAVTFSPFVGRRPLAVFNEVTPKPTGAAGATGGQTVRGAYSLLNASPVPVTLVFSSGFELYAVCRDAASGASLGDNLPAAVSLGSIRIVLGPGERFGGAVKFKAGEVEAGQGAFIEVEPVGYKEYRATVALPR